MAKKRTEKGDWRTDAGRKGGKRSLDTMAPEDRKERAKKAIEARWKRHRQKQEQGVCPTCGQPLPTDK